MTSHLKFILHVDAACKSKICSTFCSCTFSLSRVEQGLEVRNDVVRGNLMLVELHCFAFSIDQVLSKVPLDFTFRKLLLEVLVDGVGAIAFNVRLVKNWERSVVVLHHPGLDLIA